MAWTKYDPIGRGARDILLQETVTPGSTKLLAFDTNVVDGGRFEMHSIRIEYVASATVGTRLLVVELRLATVVQSSLQSSASVTVSASRNTQFIRYGAANFAHVTLTPLLTYENLPERFILMPGMDLRIRDGAAIDAAGDSAIVRILGRLS